MRSARFRFHGALHDFLRDGARGRFTVHQFESPDGVRDMVLGVPHVEVGSTEVNDPPETSDTPSETATA